MLRLRLPGLIGCKPCTKDVSTWSKPLPTRTCLILPGQLRLPQTSSGRPLRYRPGSTSPSNVAGLRNSTASACSGLSSAHFYETPSIVFHREAIRYTLFVTHHLREIILCQLTRE